MKIFKNRSNISCINYFTEVEQGQCHIYSYPFTIRKYLNITNNFPGGLFKCVTEISLFDEHPFEHEFVIQIAKSFPLMKELTITNKKPQSGRPKTKHENLFIIQYSYLKCLRLKKTHDDYVEQYLMDTKTCVSCNVSLLCDYKSLKRVTRKFTWNATRAAGANRWSTTGTTVVNSTYVATVNGFFTDPNDTLYFTDEVSNAS
ncbi:hypothetical protein I4U23_023362 [Adineta vaga]|nr:hypothetical protein I4U23_023362 [Adineta vaga]